MVGEGALLLLALNFNAGRPRWVHDQLAVLPLRNNSKRPKLENTQEKASERTVSGITNVSDPSTSSESIWGPVPNTR